MTSEQKIEYLGAQLRAVLRGDTNLITCPWCGCQNKRPEDVEKCDPLCCADFATAVFAAGAAIEVTESLDAAERISENAQRQYVTLN